MQKSFGVPAGYRALVKNNLSIWVKEGYEEQFRDFKPPEVSPRENAARHSRNQTKEETKGTTDYTDFGKKKKRKLRQEFKILDVSSTAPDYSGRGRLTVITLRNDSKERVLIRTYLRGGFLGRFVKGTYPLMKGEMRPFKELKVSAYAREAGIATPEALAAVVQRVSRFFYRGAIAVREISPGRDLQAEFFELARLPEPEALNRKRRTIAGLGRLIAQMHGAGIYHADLHLKNILSARESGEETLYLLDLDAAEIHKPLSDFKKRLNLLRLLRSAEKLNRSVIMDSAFRKNDNMGRCSLKEVNYFHKPITRTDLLRFVRSYADESALSSADLADKLLKMLSFWRLKWKLSDVLGV